MSYTNYTDLSLSEISFVAGTEYILEFVAYGDDGVTPLDLGGATLQWAMSPIGQSSYNILQKTGVITGTNTFTVTLLESDTANLKGKFIHQPVITSFGGQVYRPAQGTILLYPRIPLV